MKRAIFVSALVVSLALLAACGGEDGDADDATAEGDTTSSAGRTRTPGGSATASTGTPSTDASAVAGPTQDPNGPDGLPNSGDEGVDPNVGGGDPNAQPQVVATVPPVTPAPGVTPITDPTTVAEPEATGALRLLLDLDASQAGIQSTRDVNVGDTIRVGVVIVNAPPKVNDLGGITSFNFQINYDKTKIVAPTISGGPATERNPYPYLPDLGGTGIGWDCLPAPEGDLDDPGGIEGDGIPGTGQAFLSCFAPGTGEESGTIVLGVTTFQVIAPGSVELSVSRVSIGDQLGVELATCPGETGPAPVACEGATLNIN